MTGPSQAGFKSKLSHFLNQTLTPVRGIKRQALLPLPEEERLVVRTSFTRIDKGREVGSSSFMGGLCLDCEEQGRTE
jgi:hypothetical protein